MTTIIARLAAIAALAAPVAAAPAAAQGVFIAPPPDVMRAPALDGKRRRVARELATHGLVDVDIARLSNVTVAQLDNILHMSLSHGDKTAWLRAVLNRPGLLQRTIEGLGDRL